MTFLPIVTRELGVAARKRSTFWLRIAAALVAVVIGVGCLMLTKVGLFGTSSLGHVLFGVLTWISVAAALSAGLFFTSDCLSEEKREGTLGFLFLTDLKGYDVAGGKLLATSMRGFYALLAVLPILAVTLLMGGVAGAQFWKTSLALFNALFCSLAVGLFVSAISRDSQKALGATLALLLLFIFGGPLGDAIFAGITKQGFNPVLSLSSPAYVFRTAGYWGRTPYWLGLLITQAIAWLSFAMASALIPRTWQEKAAANRTDNKSWA
jgi:ABC-type transport system involved in multi-copper enzyme maturation permease subunit